MGMVLDLLVVIFGFGAIIFVHELGHFLAARWAGIRVLAFAIGFGPAIVSYRKGLGFRMGSSAREYAQRVKSIADGRGLAPGISPTEYRLNGLPLGGYVKMLGQDDADPSARSDETDSYQQCPPVKRMVVISAGVIMNLITAAIMFVIVFAVGLKTEAPSIGMVLPGSPAQVAGLQIGDLVSSIDGKPVEAFKDINLAVAMSGPGQALKFSVQRPGAGPDASSLVTLEVLPKEDPVSGLRSIGVTPGFADQIMTTTQDAAALRASMLLGQLGLEGALPGAKLFSPASVVDLHRAVASSDGKPVAVTLKNPDGAKINGLISPEPAVSVAWVKTGQDSRREVQHLFGLVPVLRVSVPNEAGLKAGLKAGDIFARLGSVEWPSVGSGIAEIRQSIGPTIGVVVIRDGQRVDLGQVPVQSAWRGGREERFIGFDAGSTVSSSAFVTTMPSGPLVDAYDSALDVPAAERAKQRLLPGTRITAVDQVPVTSFAELQQAIKSRVAGGAKSIVLEGLLPDAASTKHTMTLELTDAERKTAGLLGWETSIYSFFGPEEVLLVRSNPLDAVGKGISETHKMILTTYLTFARLFQGTVKVEHLKGPIGIAHIGTLLADKGWIWLLFFLAAVSVNLAVVNFLPLPIVDGGHFLFLLWEQFTGKPVSPAIQNIAAIFGLALIGVMFLVVTYNDLANLLWR